MKGPTLKYCDQCTLIKKYSLSILISATYSYGALVFSPQSRAMRLSIFDGTDMIASIAGAVLAPIIKDKVWAMKK